MTPRLAALLSWRRSALRPLARRLTYFWVVWSALLLVHEGGHVLAARGEGLPVRRMTVGVGPELWRTQRGGTEFVLRLVPVAGVTKLGGAAQESDAPMSWDGWRRESLALLGGVSATLALAIGLAVVVLTGERGTGRHWTGGRFLVADALVLTIFNFLPVPPLDGGRALLEAVAAARGAPLPDHALFWVRVSGLALAVVPMTLWTRWTARLDAAAMWWKAPAPRADARPRD